MTAELTRRERNHADMAMVLWARRDVRCLVRECTARTRYGRRRLLPTAVSEALGETPGVRGRINRVEGPNLPALESEVHMRKIIVGIMLTAVSATAPAIASAEPPPNGRNCVGVADSAGARAGGFGAVVSDIATSRPGAIRRVTGDIRERKLHPPGTRAVAKPLGCDLAWARPNRGFSVAALDCRAARWARTPRLRRCRYASPSPSSGPSVGRCGARWRLAEVSRCDPSDLAAHVIARRLLRMERCQASRIASNGLTRRVVKGTLRLDVSARCRAAPPHIRRRLA